MRRADGHRRGQDALVVTEVARGEWTVRGSDDASATNRGSMLGLIEQNRNSFEVVQFGDPLTFSSYPDLEQALTSFSRTARAGVAGQWPRWSTSDIRGPLRGRPGTPADSRRRTTR
ncbi:MAG: hypothetical protein JWQ68_1496 [Cryobacterium sp.]|jgi:hypothetical protein|nr:hypothetical protein [Cryobacterium sp.]